MKKFAKILTVLLTVCLLAGVVTATVVSAETTDITQKQLDDNGSKFQSSSAAGFSRGTSDEGYVNSYVRMYRNENHDAAVAGKLAFTGDTSVKFNGYAYVIHDFDFMSDQYLDVDGNLTTVAADGVKLAYQDGFSFYHARHTAHKCYIVEDNGLWYAADAATYTSATKTIPLLNDKGAWNHFTQIVDGVNAKSYYFINGQFLTQVDVSSTITKSINYFYAFPVAGKDQQFSIGLDNASLMFYAKNYTGALNNYINNSDYNTNPLYDCDDVRYNLDYSYVREENVVASVTNSEKTNNYYVLDVALNYLDGLSGEVTLETRKSIVDLEIPSGISTLTVVCSDDATFSFIENGYYLDGDPDTTVTGKTTYVVKKEASAIDAINATWYNVAGEQITNSDVYVNDTVQIPAAVENANANIKGTAKYEWSVNSGDYSEFVPGTTVVPEGATAIYIRPVTATVTWKGVSTDSLTVDDVVETWYKGSVLDDGDHLASFSSYKETGIAGWTVLKYAEWEGFVDGVTTVDGDATYNPVMTHVAAVDYKANITLFDKYIFNIYVEVPTDSKITNVKFDGKDVAPVDGSYVVSSAEQDYRISSTGYDSFKTTISFDVDGKAVSYEATVTTQDYVEKALEKYDCSTVAGKLIINFVNYIKNCSGYDSSLSSKRAWLRTLITEHEGHTCLNSTIPDAGTDESDGSTDTEGTDPVPFVTYRPYISSGMVNYVYFVVLVPKSYDLSAEAISATYKGITNQDIVVNFTTDGALVDKEDTSTYDVYISTEYAIYNLLETMTITIGDKKTIEYNIVDYIGYLKGDGAGTDKDIALMESLYRFAEAAKAFKMDVDQ